MVIDVEIEEEVVFDPINQDNLDEQVCCMKYGFVNPKLTGKIFTCLLCKDCQLAFKCAVEVMIKQSASSRMFLQPADIIEKVLPSDEKLR